MRPAHGGFTGIGGFAGMVAFDGNGFLELGNTAFALCEGCGWFEESIRSVAFWDQSLEYLANHKTQSFETGCGRSRAVAPSPNFNCK